ncbi:MAG: 2Fe-2S iron-sulfur cluster-binding protein [Rhodocyclaceae bacterium]|nr:2Fe-2S iron-sulfur cluster-binding protein [Rhodocyclaceae bacterium]
MSQMLTLSRAAHLLGTTRAVLQRHIAEGRLPSYDGMVTSEDLQKLFPHLSLEDAGAFERVSQIKEQAFGKRVRERVLPNQEVLAERLLAQGEELEETRRTLARYHDLIEGLHERLERALTGPHAALARELRAYLDEELARALGAEEPKDEVAVMNEILRVVAAHVKVKPSGHEFFVEGNETILAAALRAGLAPSYGCANGNCGLCKARIVAGSVRQVHHYDYPLSEKERAQGYTLLCSHTAVTDLVVEMLEANSPADIPPQEIVAKVKSIQPLARDIALLHLVTPRTHRFRFLAGQRAALSVSGQNGNFRGEYPIASCPCDDRNLLFHIPRDEEEDFARLLFSGALKSGDAVSLFGPFGEFVLDKESRDDLLFVACDTGFAPVKSLIEHALSLDMPGSLFLVWVATHPDGHYLANQCRAWADAIETLDYRLISESDLEKAGQVASETALTFAPNRPRFAYLVGPAAFLAAAERTLIDKGMPPARIKTEVL